MAVLFKSHKKRGVQYYSAEGLGARTYAAHLHPERMKAIR